MPKSIKPIRIDSSALASVAQIDFAQVLSKFAKPLEVARREIAEVEADQLRQIAKRRRQESTVDWKDQEPNSGFFELPQDQLLGYYVDREKGPLGQLLATTKRLAAQVDQVVVVGCDDYLLAMEVLMESAAQPRFNLLTRGQRGSRPRLHRLSTLADNDAVQGMLYLLQKQELPSFRSENAWAVVAIDPQPDCPVLGSVLDALASATSEQTRDERTIAVYSPDTLAGALPAGLELHLPHGLTKLTSILSAVGLVPAALLGINVMRLQEGALAMSQHFREAPLAENLPIIHAVASHAVGRRGGRVQTQSEVTSLQPLVQWAKRLLCEARCSGLNRQPDEAAGLCWSVESAQSRFDTLPRFAEAANSPSGSSTARTATARIATDSAEPESVPIKLPGTDEASLGQLLQLMMLSRAIQMKLAVSD